MNATVWQQVFFVVAVMFKRDKLRWHPRPNIAVDIVTIATLELARNREEVVFYFLPRILEIEQRESRRKKLKTCLCRSSWLDLWGPLCTTLPSPIWPIVCWRWHKTLLNPSTITAGKGLEGRGGRGWRECKDSPLLPCSFYRIIIFRHLHVYVKLLVAAPPLLHGVCVAGKGREGRGSREWTGSDSYPRPPIPRSFISLSNSCICTCMYN